MECNSTALVLNVADFCPYGPVFSPTHLCVQPCLPLSDQPCPPLSVQPHPPLGVQPHPPLSVQPHPPLSDQPCLPLNVFPPLPAPPLLRARVIFSWTGSKDNHLPIQRGEMVTVLKQSEKWWSGEAGGKVSGGGQKNGRLGRRESDEKIRQGVWSRYGYRRVGEGYVHSGHVYIIK